ncbi:riboflavin kinase [Exophiala xenobiotica]|uniref:Riboflavin kinase n=1 Tax=Lithohypha guttulata TaxID=1690604 RepID=A0ABR0KLW2_9EURO|nr:riboflavin kinase [Lithohypha guttulata]KAK5327082.1 riboflavin kinase [Exophiala xenobiotica]
MRPDYAGPERGPEAPFPIKLRGPVIKGFGRGSKELGIPTANIPPEGLSAHPDLTTGIYFGYASLQHPQQDPKPETDTEPGIEIYPCVLSIGYNPFYANKTRSIEIHILHDFSADFYGSSLKLLMLGFIRPEYDYVSKESLIEDIRTDCRVAERSLRRVGWRLEDEKGWEEWLRDFGWAEGLTWKDVEKVEDKVLAKGDQKL